MATLAWATEVFLMWGMNARYFTLGWTNCQHILQTLIEIVIGLILAGGFILLVRQSRSYAREKRAIAVGLVVAALIYVGFAVVGGSVRWMLIEVAGVAIYAVFAWLGLKRSGWLLAVGWALHPLWDAGLHGYATQFVPHWYVNGCIGFDLLVAAYVAFRGRNRTAHAS